MDEESVKQLKVTELKAELQKLGLSVSGKKEDLQNRLLDFLLFRGAPLGNIDGTLSNSEDIIDTLNTNAGPIDRSGYTLAVNNNGQGKSSNTTHTIQLSSIGSSINTSATGNGPVVAYSSSGSNGTYQISPDLDRTMQRAVRFGVPLSDKDRARFRAERFSTSSSSSSISNAPSSSKDFKKIPNVSEDLFDEDRLKMRQARFGGEPISDRLKTLEEEEARKRRAERFNSSIDNSSSGRSEAGKIHHN